MTITRQSLCFAYGTIGIIALVGTWGNILTFVERHGFWDGTVQFWQDVLVNEASRFITIDTLFLGLAVIVWMLLEAKRLKIAGVWLYVGLALLVAISLAVPLFLIHRERRLAALEPNSPAGELHPAALAGLAGLGLAICAYTVVALLR